MKISKIAFIILVAFYAVHSFAAELRPGTYFGTSLADKVTIYLKEVPGRKGSFLAVITKENKLGFAYLVDKFTSNKYGMIPLQALDNNVIGAENHNPSLILTVSKDKNYDRISVVSNVTDNKVGFTTQMSFRLKNRLNKSEWVERLEGTFSYNREKLAATLTAQDVNHEATLSIKTGIAPGDYVLREVRPGIHLVLNSFLTTTGVEITEQTNLIAVFTKEGGMYIMDTTTGKIDLYKQR